MSTKRFIILPTLTAVFICLAFIAFNNTPLQIDLDLGSFIQGDGSHESFMRGVSWFGDGWIPFFFSALFFIVLYIFKRKAQAVFLLINLSVFAVINVFLKWLIDRPRPEQPLDGGGTSFPSGHTGFAMVFFGYLFIITPSLVSNSKAILLIRALSFAAIILMGISRIYINVHWPSDTLGGVLLGTLILGWLFYFFGGYWLKEKGGCKCQSCLK